MQKIKANKTCLKNETGFFAKFCTKSGQTWLVSFDE